MAKRNQEMTIEEALEQIRRYPVVDVWPTAAVALGVSRSSAYQAIRNGEIDCLDVGHRRKPISSSLRKRLGLD